MNFGRDVKLKYCRLIDGEQTHAFFFYLLSIRIIIFYLNIYFAIIITIQFVTLSWSSSTTSNKAS